MKSSKKYWQLTLLFVLFLFPLIAAWFISKQDIVLGTTNYGTWVKPSLSWQDKVLPTKKNWKLLLYVSGNCDAICLEKLDQLARVRLAMGRKVYDLDIRLILQASRGNQSLQSFLKKQAIDLEVVENIDEKWGLVFNQFPLVLLDEANKAVLMYPLNFEPKKLYHDLQHLIH